MIYVSTETKSSSGLGHGFYYNLNLSLIARTRQTDRGGSGTNIYILGVRIHIQESFFFSEILKELSKKIRQRKRISPFLFHLHFGKDPSLLRYLRNLKSKLQCELAVSKLVEYTLCVCSANCLHVRNTNHPFSHCHPPLAANTFRPLKPLHLLLILNLNQTFGFPS